MECAVGASVCVYVHGVGVQLYSSRLRHSGTIHDLLSGPQWPSLLNQSQLAGLRSLQGFLFTPKSKALCGKKKKSDSNSDVFCHLFPPTHYRLFISVQQLSQSDEVVFIIPVIQKRN